MAKGKSVFWSFFILIFLNIMFPLNKVLCTELTENIEETKKDPYAYRILNLKDIYSEAEQDIMLNKTDRAGKEDSPKRKIFSASPEAELDPAEVFVFLKMKDEESEKEGNLRNQHTRTALSLEKTREKKRNLVLPALALTVYNSKSYERKKSYEDFCFSFIPFANNNFSSEAENQKVNKAILENIAKGREFTSQNFKNYIKSEEKKFDGQQFVGELFQSVYNFNFEDLDEDYKKGLLSFSSSIVEMFYKMFYVFEKGEEMKIDQKKLLEWCSSFIEMKNEENKKVGSYLNLVINESTILKLILQQLSKTPNSQTFQTKLADESSAPKRCNEINFAEKLKLGVAENTGRMVASIIFEPEIKKLYASLKSLFSSFFSKIYSVVSEDIQATSKKSAPAGKVIFLQWFRNLNSKVISLSNRSYDKYLEEMNKKKKMSEIFCKYAKFVHDFIPQNTKKHNLRQILYYTLLLFRLDFLREYTNTIPNALQAYDTIINDKIYFEWI